MNIDLAAKTDWEVASFSLLFAEIFSSSFGQFGTKETSRKNPSAVSILLGHISRLSYEQLAMFAVKTSLVSGQSALDNEYWPSKDTRRRLDLDLDLSLDLS